MVTVGNDEWVFGFPQDEVVIGAAPSSGLVLDHETVAPRHAKIALQKGRAFAESLGAQPLVVNDQSIGRKVIQEGDVIEIGVYELGILSRDPPGKMEQDLLDAIAKSPQDDAPRAVYGDWLEENGRHEDAEFLRAQIEIRRLGQGGERFLALSRTIATLGPRMPAAWRRAVARPAIENCDARFEVDCPKTWDELAPTEKADERWCRACSRRVYYATSIERARRLAIVGRCVALDLTVPRRPNDLRPEPASPVMMMGAVAPVLRRH